MVTQRKCIRLNITVNAQGQIIESGKVELNKSEVGHEMQSRAKTKAVLVVSGRSTNTHACMHDMAYLWKWE